MTALSSYDVGTVSVAADGTTVTGVSTLWLTAGNVKPGYFFTVGHFGVFITDVADDAHLTITRWPGATVSGATYSIWKVAQGAFNTELLADVDRIVTALNANGYIVFVPPTLTAPDPSLGEENQSALQPTTGKMWVMTGGVWTFLGIYKGFNPRGAYDNAATYSVGDSVSSAGSSYVWSNATPGSGHAPPNATYWQLQASKGDPGGTGPTGAGYGGTSTTSRTIGVGSQVFTTQAGLAYQNGARVRASSAANTANWMEGLAAYSGTTLTINVDKTGGSGTLADWNFNVSGQPGAGDLSSANALSELKPVADKARANIGVLKKNYILNGGMQISQENANTAGSTANYYPVDQFFMSFTGTSGAISVQQVASPTPGGSPNRIRATVTTADAAVGAGDLVGLFQRIEGLRVADLKAGTAGAKTVTLQFGCKGPAATYCCSFRNGAANRSYIAEYVISSGEANTDVVKSITVPLDQAGTWTTDNTIGLDVSWSLMAGSTFATAAGAWAAGNFTASPNQFNFMGTNGNVFELFDVSVTEGASAPAFQLPDYVAEVACCKRYWQKITVGLQNGSIVNGASYGSVFLFAAMRAAPAIALIANSIAGGNFPATAPSQAITTNYSTLSYKTATASGNGIWADDLSLNARL
ncbi:hypothetical protein ABIA95_003055 [Bradyrhizobium sp. LA8.1]|uniref:hypothetical protein n=1 Tax=unclassified Bradyrhizobium TaxID=2631580 RepID=UPI003393B22C